MAKRYDWVGVAGKDYVFVGVKGKFAQLGHGKKILSKQDQRCQPFTAIDSVTSHEVYQIDLGEGLLLNHLDVDFELCEEASILPLEDSFSFVENKKSWQYPFRVGHLEISEEDFEWLAEEMRLEVDSIKH